MNCNCNNKPTSGDKGEAIWGVFGNVLKIGIPLTLRTLEKVTTTVDDVETTEIVATDTDFVPSDQYPVTIEFKKKGGTRVAFDAQMRDGNVAYMEDDGTIPIGDYDITVLCKDGNGRPYRFKQRTVLHVVDYTADAGIDKDIEFEAQVWYLNPAVFLALKGDKGDTGVGIQNIVISDSDESLGINTVTIILDNGNEYTFTVLNGIYDPQGYVHTDNNYTNQDKQIVRGVNGRINALNRSALGNVVYDPINKEMRGIPVDDGGEGNFLFRIDMTPFLSDKFVNEAYIFNGHLFIEYNPESGKEPLDVNLSDWINPSDFYTKEQADDKFLPIEEREKFVQLNAAEKINYSAMPFVVLSSLNLVYNGSANASLVGKAYYCTDGYIRYFFRKDGSISNIYASPVQGILYCLESTGDIYRWDASSRIFRLTNANAGVDLSNYYTKAQIEMLLDGVEVDTSGLMSKLDYVSQGRIKFDKASRVVLDFIIFPVVPGEEHEERVLEGGDFYGDEDGHICYESIDNIGTETSIDLGVHTELAFVNAEDNKIYRWTGSAWQMVGGSGGGGYEPPVGGIPKSDLSQEVQASLAKADTALQQHQDISGKVDKEQGKGLSTNDYTTAEKEKLAGLSAQVQSDWEESDTSSPAYIQNKPTIPTAINGKSAYQIAVDNGFVGTEAQWLESLHGQDGEDGQDGTNGTDGQDGQDGKSAYQSYLDTTSDNPVKTEAQWIASLKGERGDTGAKGDKGDKGDSGVSLGEVVLEQTTGQSTTSVMSQKGVTDAIEEAPAHLVHYPVGALKANGAVISSEKYKKIPFNSIKYLDVTTRFYAKVSRHWANTINLFSIVVDNNNYITTIEPTIYYVSFALYKNGTKAHESVAIAQSDFNMTNNNILFDFYSKKIVVSKCTSNGTFSIVQIIDISEWDLSAFVGNDVYFTKKIFTYDKTAYDFLFCRININSSPLIISDTLNKRTLPYNVDVFDSFPPNESIDTTGNITGLSNAGLTVTETISATHKKFSYNNSNENFVAFFGSGSNVYYDHAPYNFAVKFKLLSGTPTFNNLWGLFYVLKDDYTFEKLTSNTVFEVGKEYIITTNNSIAIHQSFGVSYYSWAPFKVSGTFEFEAYDPIVIYPIGQTICSQNFVGKAFVGDIPFDAGDVVYTEYSPNQGLTQFYHDGEIKVNSSGTVYIWNGSVWKQISNA